MTFPSLSIAAKPNVNIVFGAVRVVCILVLTVIAVLNLLTFAARGSSLHLSQTPRVESPVTNPLDPQASITRPTRSVKPGDSVDGELESDKSESFSVPLVAGRFVKFRVEQHGMVLQVTLVDPNGTQIIQLDAHAGGYGPIMFSTIAAISGDYRLELKSINSWALKYKYEIFIDRDRNIESQDALQIASEKSFSEGRKSWKTGDQASAIRSYEAANDFWKNTENYHWQAVVQYALSEAYRNSDISKSEAYLNETLRILNIETAPNDWRLQASAINDLGAIYLRLGTAYTEKATDLLNQSLSLFASHNDLRGQASSLNQLATIQFRDGNLSRARELINQALTLRRAANDKPAVNNLINALGVIADGLGEPEQALNYAKESLRSWEALGELNASDKRRVASVLTSLATASDKLGQWDQALEYYDKALALYSEKDQLRAVTLDSKGELYVVLGNPAKAKECYDQALEIINAAGKPDVDSKAALLVHIGQLQIDSGEIDNGIRTFEEALSLQPPIARQADIQTNLAAAYIQKGDLKKALAIYDSTLKLQTGRQEQQRGQALTRQKRGEAYTFLGQQDEALHDLRSALPLWRAIKDQRGEASTLNAIARVEQARGNLESALSNNDEAIRIIESLRTNISSHQLRTSYFANQENYYEFDVDLKMQLSKIQKRSEYFAAALESTEKARARVLLDSLNEAGVGRINPDNADPRLSSLIEEKLKLLSTLAFKAQARTRFLNGPHSPEQIAKLDRELTDLNTRYDDLETTIRSVNRRFATLTKPVPANLAQIQQQLDNDTLLIEFLLGDHRSYAWVVGINSIEGTELPARREIEDLAKRVSKALSERGRFVKNESDLRWQQRIKTAESDYGEASSLLSKAVLAPIAHLLTKKRLIIVADGALQSLPFEALPDPDQLIAGARPAQPVIEKHEIVTLPSASVLVLQRRELKDRKPAPYLLAVIADPVFGELDPRVTTNQRGKKSANDKTAKATPPTKTNDNEAGGRAGKASQLSRALEDVGIQSVSEISRLPFSLLEARAILETVPANQSFSALSFEANRKTVMDPKLSRYRIVHLATHGVMDLAHPELSGVLLSMVDKNGKEQNGYLGLNEIYNLSWPAELVVLSACETGVGKEIKGEGLIALTRGFMYAGAARVIASLWKVNDKATAELMTEFYRQMLGNRLTPAAALRAAQLKLSHQPRWQNPHFWAGFVLQGEWR